MTTPTGTPAALAALTSTCAMGLLLTELPRNRGPRTDLDQVVTALTGVRR
ncbi:MAG: hypothetical protein SYR96_25345 [Actinomycetota bacterium]|nr:hypothetical protein [Actinomycetota bacterium]